MILKNQMMNKHQLSQFFLVNHNNSHRKGRSEKNFLTTETLLLAEVMRTARIRYNQMQKILNVLQTPGFQLNRIAPTVYYLKKAEAITIPDTVIILFYQT